MMFVQWLFTDWRQKYGHGSENEKKTNKIPEECSESNVHIFGLGHSVYVIFQLLIQFYSTMAIERIMWRSSPPSPTKR